MHRKFLPNGVVERLNGIIHVESFGQCLVHSGYIILGIGYEAAARC